MEKEGKDFLSSVNTPMAVLIGSLIIAGAIILSGGGKIGNITDTAGINPEKREITVNGISDDDHFYGNPKAEVVMIEFSDLECPFCKRFHETAKRLVDDSRGKIAWVYRHFPLDQIHSKARKEAEATECAAELGGNDMFWNYTDELFKITPSNNGLDLAELPKIAERVGLNKTQFEACLSSGKYKDKVDAQFKDGLNAGVSGTPHTIFVNQKGEKIPIVGAQPYEALKTAAEQLK